jgi:hypothetical protein
VTYTFAKIMLNGCDQLNFGVQINGQNQQLGTNLGNQCLNTLFTIKNTRVTVPAGTSVLIYLQDATCGATYYSDGTGTGNHAAVFTGGGDTTHHLPTQVDITDAGNCRTDKTGDRIPAQGGGNLDLITNATLG